MYFKDQLINGKHKSCPDTNFVKLDVSKAKGLGDGVHILWKNANYEWEIVVQKSNILLTKLALLIHKLILFGKNKLIMKAFK